LTKVKFDGVGWVKDYTHSKRVMDNHVDKKPHRVTDFALIDQITVNNLPIPISKVMSPFFSHIKVLASFGLC